jgi:hypothetical protein
MVYLLSAETSNRANWSVQVSATDADTGEAIDFSAASITVAVKDDQGCQRLLATTGNGKVTLPTTGTMQFDFADSEMRQLCPATYQIGAIYETVDGPFQLFVGTVSIYDGVVP